MRSVKFIENGIYHIFNRGVDKRIIFQDDSDRWRFIQALCLFNDKDTSANLLWKMEYRKGGLNFRTLNNFLLENRKDQKPLVKIMADCLMPNHYHLILKEIEDGGISRFMHKVGTGYTEYFNKKHNRAGRFFQGTFKAVPVDNDLYLQYLLVYLNVVNPGQIIEPKIKEDGVNNIDAVIKFVDNYVWSTHQDYLGKRNSAIIDKCELAEFFSNPIKYREFAREVLLSKKYDKVSSLFLE